MTTAEIVNFVDTFGSDVGACSDALLEKLMAKELSMEELEQAIGEGSDAYPFGYPVKGNLEENDVIEIVNPSFLARLAVKKMRAEGNKFAFAC